MWTKKICIALKLVAALAGVVALVGCKPPGPKALEDGKRLLEKGRPVEAMERLQVAAELLRTNAQAWNYLGVACHQAGRWAEATNAYRRAFHLSPDLTEAHLNLGVLYLELGRASEAKLEFTAYTLRRPNAAEGYQRLASAEIQLREAALAELHIRKAIQLNDADPASWNTLGLIQLQRGRQRDAATSFGAALQKQPDHAPSILNLAILNHQHFNDRVTALKLYRQYVALKPRPADADSVLAIIRDLEAELTPARPVAVAPPQAAPVAAPVVAAKSVVTNSAPAKAATAPAPRPEPVVAKPTPAPAPVRPAPTVVTLPPEPAIKSAAANDVQASAPPPKPVPTAATGPSTAPAAAAEDRRTFLQSINPVNLFKRSKQTVTPLPTPESAVPADLANSRSTAASTEETPSPKSISNPVPPVPTSVINASFPRYTYHGAGNMAPGDRTSAQRFAGKGAEAMATKRYVEAMNAFRAAAEADPSWFQAHLNHSAAALQCERVIESLHAGETALALKPDSVEARYNFALALKRGNYAVDAAAELERLLAANPDEVEAHLVAGNLYAEQLRLPDRARAHYLRVLELKPKHPRATAIRFWLKANPQ